MRTRSASQHHAQDVKLDAFPLPTLGPKLKAMQHEASFGRGFQMIKGVPVDRYTRADLSPSGCSGCTGARYLSEKSSG